MKLLIKRINLDKVSNYWNKVSSAPSKFVCPNIAFFRLLGEYFDDLNNIKALEIGFGNGADFKELSRRGANIYGLDMSNTYVNQKKNEFGDNVSIFYAGKDSIPFKTKFDLIYSLDMVYYLTNSQLLHFFKDCQKNLNREGVLIVQIIENDLQKSKFSLRKNIELDMSKLYVKKSFYESDNPIRNLNTKDVIHLANESCLKLNGGKFTIESYDKNENLIRINRYLVFKLASDQIVKSK